MGLDQSAFFLKKGEGIQDVDESNESYYWRKHPNLEGWMAEKYYEKGGKGDFNCKELELNLEDIERLESAVKLAAETHPSLRFIKDDKTVPYPDEPPLETNVKGFFFGSNANEEYYEYDLEFIKDAKDALKKGLRVIYTSSW